MPTVDIDVLRRFAKRLVERFGADESTAESVARSLVGADARGHHSHGIRRLASRYYPEVQTGQIDPTARPEIRERGPLSATVDGRRAFGQVVGRKAADAVAARASSSGVGVVGLTNVSHIGRVGEWAERVAEREMLFLAFVSSPGSRYVAPPGSADRRLSTNPIALGAPSFGALPFPLVLDIATSQVAHGKIRERAAAGEAVPDGWVVTESGESLRDSERFEEEDAGAMLPLGGLTAGYKGFGLSVMSELFGAILSDGFVSGEEGVVWGNTAAFVAIDPTLHASADAARERVRALASYLRETDFSASVETGEAAVGESGLLPGEAEFARLQTYRESGVPISDADAELLCELAAELNADDDVPPALRPSD